MLTQLYPSALRVLGCLVAVLSTASSILLAVAPAPEGLAKLDPGTLRTTAVVVIGVFGVLLPVAILLGRSMKKPLLKAVVFAAAGFGNAIALGPPLAVPVQDTMGLIATVCSLGITVLSLLVYMDAVQRQKPPSKF